MFKTIFQKLLVTYLVLIILIVTTLSLILTTLYSRHVFQDKHAVHQSTAFKVNQLANNLDERNISQKELETTLDSLGYTTDSKIYLVRLDKNALSGPDTMKLGSELEDSFLVDDLKKIMDGQTVFRQKQYSQNFDMHMVFTGVPWKSGNAIKGAILLFSPVNHISNDIVKINLVIWPIGLFFIFISAIIIYIISRRISNPIREMEHAAAKLAAGENTQDLIFESRDEVGRLAKTFNFMKQQLNSTEKMRREFIANVSHDLRTPLTSISGFVQGMLDGLVKPPDYPKYLNIIRNETDRLIRLTSDILQIAQLQSGNIHLNKEILDVRDIVDTVLDNTQISLDEKTISITFDAPSGTLVYADKDRLKQILINLVSNSIKYGRQGGNISLNVLDMAGITRFSVKDNGIGIDEEELPFIFEKFYRVDKSRQSSQSGTGLGLNIVKNLVELHGGRIWAESKIEGGTEVIFEIPKK
jgi:signal transduction histidine kinase